MKMWKKFAAALLVAAMALTMLTACGGSGTAAIVRDKEQEEKLYGYISDFLAKNQMGAMQDEALEPLVDAVLPGAVKYCQAYLKNDSAGTQAALSEMGAAGNKEIEKLGRKAVVFTVPCLGTVNEATIPSIIAQSGSAIQSLLNQAGISNPGAYAVGAVKDGVYVYLVFVLAESAAAVN